MESSRIKRQLLSVYKKIAEKHKFCSLHLTAIFYITCYGLCLFFFQLIELPINIINELNNHNQYPGP
jgi:hypothetical protein